MSKDAEVVLRAGLAELHLSLSDDQVRDLLYFQNLIGKWNKVYNLTAVREQAEMLTHHLLDSLAAVEPLQKYLQGRSLSAANLLDVGSGAGLPGVVLAICFPTLAVTCVDTVGKKAAFIKHVALALGLPNLTGLHARVETITQPFDVICARAFASLSDFTVWSQAALAPGGAWMALKGKHPAEELSILPPDVAVFHVEPLAVPGLAAERCIIWLQKVG
ncbi:MAG: 16S rRNA (guanine(527)-N(7))-methyltransferase RsmG [Rhodospirillales bacterium]|nr:16S rRNA (guanine(527)-N(7))-methyltransferase RsmG [Rhodospirillales bacterium]